MNDTSPRRAYSAAETANITGIPTSTLYRWARAGKAGHLGCVRIGNKTVFAKATIDQLFPSDKANSK